MLSINELNYVISELVFLKETTFYLVPGVPKKSPTKKITTTFLIYDLGGQGCRTLHLSVYQMCM